MNKKRSLIMFVIVLAIVVITGFSTCSLMGKPVDATITVRKL